MQHLTRSLHLLTRLSHPSSLTPTPAITAALGRTCCCLCLLTPSVVVTPPHRRVPRASLTDAPPVPPHQVQRSCVALPFCVCFVRPSAQGRLLLRVLRAFRLLRCVKLFYQLTKSPGALIVLIEEAEQSSHSSVNGPKRRRAKREYVGQDAASRDELETENPTESACASDGETERAERA